MFSIEYHLRKEQEASRGVKTPNFSPARSPVAKYDPNRTFGSNVSPKPAHYVQRQGTDVLNQSRATLQPRPFKSAKCSPVRSSNQRDNLKPDFSADLNFKPIKRVFNEKAVSPDLYTVMSHNQNVKTDISNRNTTIVVDATYRYNSPSRRYANSPTRKTTITPTESRAKLPTAEKEYRRQE